ncbi:MAG TPA: class I SAM-dependent rRNA methyltransferase [Bacillota bacterium]|nr:class I SAM-dependent rRNA methyltransferase [Bacillota bacterium]
MADRQFREPGRVRLVRGRAPRLEMGHPWVFRSEIETVDGTAQPGDVVEVADHRGRYLGRGFWNPDSQITVRLLTREDRPVDAAFIHERVRAAWQHRIWLAAQGLLGPRTDPPSLARVVNAEADGLPAVIADRFGDIVVVQALARGAERLLPVVLDALEATLQPKGIFARNDAPVRALEGLPLEKGWLRGTGSTRPVVDDGRLTVEVDVEGGQKTGYFLDQAANRHAIAPFCPGTRVLDAFCYTGGFGLHAASYGAAEVNAIDSSSEAIELAAANAERNSLSDRVRFRVGNAFDELRALQRAGQVYDLVILDPPSFARSRAALPGAIRGYKEINLRALGIIRPGGFLVTSSCSYHLSAEDFRQILVEAGRDARRSLRLLDERGQSPDHPVLLAAPETRYLKCLFLQVL